MGIIQLLYLKGGNDMFILRCSFFLDVLNNFRTQYLPLSNQERENNCKQINLCKRCSQLKCNKK